MDAQTGFHSEAEGPRAIQFTGSWREYLPIAVTNALLCIVTLGIYRFWASARQRRYLWSRTIFIDDCLEWSGTGKEMFLGFLIVMCFLIPFYLFFQFAFPALIVRGKAEAAFGVISLFELAIFYLAGFARFRALRYRLSRSWWHGIRGGSDDPGWNYGGEYLGRYLLTFITMFIVFPWAATRLWNSRWNAMSFGQLRFRTNLNAEGLKARWALIYLAFFGVFFAAIGTAAGAAIVSDADTSGATIGAIVVGVLLLFYIAIPLATLHWYAKFFRNAADSLELGDLRFGFDATTWDWLKLVLGTLGLIIVTLGFGLTYAGYRNWSFMVRHMHVYGDVDVSKLEQSNTHAPTEAEGFADAFDIGAI
jgi:uncharacterized membrane protein YjgN (DUF898 family)